jgi:hypothetical protein
MAYTVKKWRQTRFWAVWDGSGALVCVCAYKRGAESLRERLEGR